MTRRNLVSALAAALVLVAGLLGPLPATHAAGLERAQQEVDLVKVLLSSSLYFSPNGDGVRDDALVDFRVRKAARVVIEVRRGGRSLLRKDLGRLAKGDHQWSWDGRRAGGTLVPEGYYEVVLRASRDGKSERTSVSAWVDTTNRGRLVTGRRTVFPQADVVHDRIQVVMLERGWSPFEAEYGDIWQERTTLKITDRQGRVVWRDLVKNSSTPAFEWDGTDGDGHALAPGRYDVHVRTIDGAGNPLRLSTRFRVSAKQLVEQVWSTTVAAADAQHYVPYFGGCNGCGDVCEPVASTRFSGGLSYRPCASTFFFATRGYYAADVPFPVAPVDQFRVGATGGPTTPGGLDHGSIGAGTESTTVAGEGTTTSQWSPVTLADHPYLPDLEFPVDWTFSTSKPDSYDVATFTVEYLHYVPV